MESLVLILSRINFETQLISFAKVSIRVTRLTSPMLMYFGAYGSFREKKELKELVEKGKPFSW